MIYWSTEGGGRKKIILDAEALMEVGIYFVLGICEVGCGVQISFHQSS